MGMRTLMLKVDHLFEAEGDNMDNMFDQVLGQIKAKHDRDQIRRHGYVKEPFDQNDDGEDMPKRPKVFDISDDVEGGVSQLDQLINYVADRVHNPADHHADVDFDSVAAHVADYYKQGVTDKDKLVELVQADLAGDSAQDAPKVLR